MGRYKKAHSRFVESQRRKQAIATNAAIADRIGNGHCYMPAANNMDNLANMQAHYISVMYDLLDSIEKAIILGDSYIRLYMQLESCFKKLELAGITCIEDSLYNRIEKINASLRLHKELPLEIEAITRVEYHAKRMRYGYIRHGNAYRE